MSKETFTVQGDIYDFSIGEGRVEQVIWIHRVFQIDLVNKAIK